MTKATVLEYKNELLLKVKEILSEGLNKTKARQLQCFADIIFSTVPASELRESTAKQLAAAIASQLEFITSRPQATCKIRVFNPDEKEHGWENQHTIVELCNDDMPFLVDTANLVISDLNLEVHTITHPLIRVARDESGELTALAPLKDDTGLPESIMHIQVDRQSEPEILERIEADLRSAMAAVRLAVTDWPTMTERVKEAVSDISKWASVCDPGVVDESQAFIQWMADDHFIFLGSRDYRVVREGKSSTLDVVPGSGLGILRENDRTILSRPVATLSEMARLNRDNPLIITKTKSRSKVHRSGYMDYVGILQFDADGETIGERRFLGLFTSNAYFRRAASTPLVRQKVEQVLSASALSPGSHAYKSLVHILETLPREDLFQATLEELNYIATEVLNLQERKRARLLVRRERFARFFSCLVYIPRDRFNTENREKIQRILFRAFQGEQLDYVLQISESALARLQVIIRTKPGSDPNPDIPALEQKIVEAIRSWQDQLTSILVKRYGEENGLLWSRNIAQRFPAAYEEDVSPWVASYDVERIARLGDEDDLLMSLYRPRGKETGLIRFKIFRRGKPIYLSQVLPMLENLGLHVVSERPYELRDPEQSSVWVQDFEMSYDRGAELNLDEVRDIFQEAFENAWRGLTNSDGINRLILASGLHWREVKILRAYSKYLLQTGSPFSLDYMAATFDNHPLLARLLIELFDTLFNPARDSESSHAREKAARRLQHALDALGQRYIEDKVFLEYQQGMVEARSGASRKRQTKRVRKLFLRGLASVTSLDEDRILHAMYSIILATLRTNYYQESSRSEVPACLAFKIDSSRVMELPQPRPYREIWIYSPRVEGIHLRMGPIARGGLRWSDRKEDFRTEVLGLMKAQNVKNTMIVPVGAKGGFVPQRLPVEQGREAVLAEGIECYKIFINGLLDITDNLVEDELIAPEDVVRRDEDDPYLVVAADKGTATFSDTANGIANDRGFWMSDAFASGGSVGYDHKGMGITARGAWEGVKRHFRELGVDIQSEAYTAVGIGDMSGDVFGNGMLLSRCTRLKAAFNHLHIFLDPDPDEKASFKERQRLFDLPRSSWSDYDESLISRGGGVFSRLDKVIPLSKQVREWLKVEEKQLSPHDLIKSILKAEVDLLWNGGIGTYVKAEHESHPDVGDPVNTPLRVNGSELGCRVVGEGGNLGLTQAGRIEFARSGGSINTDFIDNSAGVDCSDHEVNIKLLLELALRAGELSQQERNDLLAEMTDDVAQLVLDSNYLQTQAITMMETLKGERLGAKQRFIALLEDEGQLDRALEGLPDDDELLELRNLGLGLSRPELSVLLSYSKIRLYQQLLASDIPEDITMGRELIEYFPGALQERFSHLMPDHRLKREIIATRVTNDLINRMGISFVVRMRDDTGAEPADIARAFTIAKELLNAPELWTKIESLDNKVGANVQTEALLILWTQLRQVTRWLAQSPGISLEIEDTISRLLPGLETLRKTALRVMAPDQRQEVDGLESQFVSAGFPKRTSRQIALLHTVSPMLDVVAIAADRSMDVSKVASVYSKLGQFLGLRWLQAEVENLKVQGQWHANARSNLRDELQEHKRNLAYRVLDGCDINDEPVETWIQKNHEQVERIFEMLDDMKTQASMDYATLSVAVRSLGQLLAVAK